MIEPQLFKLRVRYVKEGRLRYLAHLEVMRTVERIVRRAGLPYAVTQGFSPHMRAGFSSALPVGTGSTCEWFDLVLTDYIPADRALAALADAAPADLKPVEAGYIDMRSDALTAAITRVAYELAMQPTGACTREELQASLDKVIREGSLSYRRGAKTKTLDIAGTLVSYTLSEADGSWLLALDTRISNEGAMRPELLLAAADALCAQPGQEPELAIGPQHYTCVAQVRICRVAQWCELKDGTLVSPLARA